MTEKQLITLNEINSIRFLWNDEQPKDLPHFHQDQVICQLIFFNFVLRLLLMSSLNIRDVF